MGLPANGGAYVPCLYFPCKYAIIGCMTKRLKISLTVLYLAAIVFFIGLLVFANFTDRGKALSLPTPKLIAVLMAFSLGLVKLAQRSGGNSLDFYRESYAEIIRGSFQDDKKLMRRFLKALAHYNDDEFRKSIDLLDSILPSCKTNEERYSVEIFRALNYTDWGKLTEAAGIYESMVESGMADSRIYANLVNAYHDLGDYEKACKLGKAAIEFDPRNYSAYNNLAYSFFRSGDYAAARGYAENCLELKNSFLPAIRLLYIIHSLDGNDAEAELYAKRAVANGMSRKDLKEMIEHYTGADDQDDVDV